MILLGCEIEGRFIEQHDVFFGIGEKLSDLKDEMQKFLDAKSLHIDAWREVTSVDEYEIKVMEKGAEEVAKDVFLYFINLGGYKENQFEEFHFKMLVVARSQAEAVKQAKQTLFFKNTGAKGAPAHIDDKYGIDVDDLYNVEDILSASSRDKFSISVVKKPGIQDDTINLGYIPLRKL